LLTGALIGLLSLACCFVQPGRTFLRRLIYRTKGIHQPHFHIRLNKESRLDISAWLLFIDNINGKTMLLKQIGISANNNRLWGNLLPTHSMNYKTTHFKKSRPEALRPTCIRVSMQLVCRNVTLREQQSLIDLLSFACCVVQPGRSFLRRLIDRTKLNT
jgi:hypothetical protein